MRIFAILTLVVGLAAGCNSKTDEVKAKEEANKKALAQEAAEKETAEETAKACKVTSLERCGRRRSGLWERTSERVFLYGPFTQEAAHILSQFDEDVWPQI